MKSTWMFVSLYMLAIVHTAVVKAQKCERGANECSGNTLRICTDEGYWSEIPCPGNTACIKGEEGSTACCTGVDGVDPANTSPPGSKRRRGNEVSIGEPQRKKTTTGEGKESPIKDAPKASVATVTKPPRQIDLSTGQTGIDGKEIIYSIVLTDGKGSAPNIAHMAVSSSPNPSVPQGTVSEPGMTLQGGAVPNISSTPPSVPPSTVANANSSASSSTGGTTPSSAGSADARANSSASAGTTPSSAGTASSNARVNSSASAGTTPSSSTANANANSSASSSTGGATPSSNASAKADAHAKASTSGAQTPAPGANTTHTPDAGGQGITLEKLKSALKEVGITPKDEYASTVLKVANAHFKDKVMLAMFLAQIAHESEFVHIEELACAGNKCSGNYGTGVPGKSYHGRGPMQLSWPDNYKKASEALGMGDTLYREPELVATDMEIGVKTAIWYWDTVVMAAPGVKEKKQFGLTTKAINGPIECKPGPGSVKSKRRYKIYRAISKAMGLSQVADEGGCYDA